MMASRRWAGHCLAGAVLALAGCASAPPASAPRDALLGPWAGRMSLQVQDQPSQSFSAGFELKGNPESGDLALFSPLGGTMAVLSWQPGRAVLRANSISTEFDSVDSLVAHATGSAIPLRALFDWLRGVDTPVPGWRTDLAQLPQGRIAAKRLAPPPEASLTVLLEQ